MNLCSFNSGTPSQETWPGVSSNDEFKNYNFPKYKPQPLINHAPRYFFLKWKGEDSWDSSDSEDELTLGAMIEGSFSAVCDLS